MSNDQKSDFQDLVSKYKEYTIHQKNLPTFLIEICKNINNIALPIMNFLFFSVEMYIISKTFRFYQTAQKKPLRYGLKTVSDRSPFHGQIYKKDYKSQTCLHEFKAKNSQI